MASMLPLDGDDHSVTDDLRALRVTTVSHHKILEKLGAAAWRRRHGSGLPRQDPALLAQQFADRLPNGSKGEKSAG